VLLGALLAFVVVADDTRTELHAAGAPRLGDVTNQEVLAAARVADRPRWMADLAAARKEHAAAALLELDAAPAAEHEHANGATALLEAATTTHATNQPQPILVQPGQARFQQGQQRGIGGFLKSVGKGIAKVAKAGARVVGTAVG